MRTFLLILFMSVGLTYLFSSTWYYNYSNCRKDSIIVHSTLLTDSVGYIPCKEFFCSVGSDTSACSFLVYGHNDKTGSLSIFFSFSNTEKSFFYDSLSEEELMSYTNKIRQGKIHQRYRNRYYDEIINEFSACLKTANESYRLETLREIVFWLSDLSDCSIEITNNYLILRPSELPQSYYVYQFYKDVNKAISMTDIQEKINEVLNVYNIFIDRIIFDDEHSTMISKEDFLVKNNVHCKDVPPNILNGYVKCICKPINHRLF